MPHIVYIGGLEVFLLSFLGNVAHPSQEQRAGCTNGLIQYNAILSIVHSYSEDHIWNQNQISCPDLLCRRKEGKSND